MIALDFRTHVIDWKKTAHLSLDRRPTKEEWQSIKGIPKQYRFKNGEEIEPDRFFWAYLENCKNGMWVTTKDKVEAERARSKARSQAEDPERQKARSRTSYRKNREQIIKRTTAYNKANREAFNQRQKLWKRANPDKWKRYYRTAHERQQAIPHKRILKLLRARLRSAVTQRILYGRIQDNQSVDFLLWLTVHQGIDYKNGYDIDHLIPISKCDLSTESGQLAANSPENIRWMKHSDNMAKRAMMPSQAEIDTHLALVTLWRS